MEQTRPLRPPASPADDAPPHLVASPASGADTDTGTPPLTLDALLRATTRIAHDIPGNSRERNLVKLSEETGELARTWTRQRPRDEVIEEACDVVITALVAAGFEDATSAEISDTLRRKLERSLQRCQPVGAPDAANGAASRPAADTP